MGTTQRPVEEILQELVQKRGTGYLREGKFFVNAVRELGGEEEGCTLLEYLVAVNGHVDLLNAGSLSPAMQKSRYSQTAAKLSSKKLISQELAHQACGSFWRGVYGTNPPASAPSNNRKKEPAPVPEPAPGPADGKKPKKGMAKVLIAAVCVIACAAILAAVLGARNTPKLKVEDLPIGENVKALIAAGTKDTYTYMDGSLLELYFDSRELETARIYKNKDGSIEYVFTAEYDAGGNVLEHLTFDSSGTLVRTDSFTWNSDGNWTEHLITLEDGAVGRRYERSFLPEEGLTYYAEYAADGSLVDEENYQNVEEDDQNVQYFDDGRSVRFSEDENGNDWNTWLDADGNVTGMEKYERDENGAIVVSYDYDAEGQLLGRTEYHESGFTCYNADGSLDSEKTYFYFPEGSEIGSLVVQYGDGLSIDRSDRDEKVDSIIGTSVKGMGQARSGSYNSDTIRIFDMMENMATYISYDLEGHPTYESHYTYDANGNEIEETTISRSYNDAGKLTYEYVSRRDPQGNSVGTGKSYDEDGKLESRKEFEKKYDDQGNSLETSKTYDQDDNLTYESVLKRSPDGSYVSSDKSYDKDGKLTGTSESERIYDTDGNLASTYRSYDENGGLKYESIEQEDPQGNSVKTNRHYDAGGNLYSITESEKTYHDDGSAVLTEKDCNYDADGNLSSITESERTYSEDGSSVLTEKTCDAEGRVTETVDLTYDADNNAVSGERVSIWYYADGSKTISTYDHNYERIRMEEYNASGKLVSAE